MGYQIYKVGERWGGYGVPAICEQPECTAEIDRGMSHACGGEPFSEYGCDKYFCEKHLNSVCLGEDEEGEYGIIEDCECTYLSDEHASASVCGSCANGLEPFPYKPEHPEWIEHLLTDESWEEWRIKNPKEVDKLKSSLITKKDV